MADMELLAGRGERARARLSVDVSPELEQKLNDLAYANHVTKSDVLRDAVRLLLEYDRLRKEGYSLGGWRTAPDGSRETISISIGA